MDVGDPRTWWPDALTQLSAAALPLRPDHLLGLQDLAVIHNDPFDRVLIVQALAEDLTLVTTDQLIAKYRSARLEIIN